MRKLSWQFRQIGLVNQTTILADLNGQVKLDELVELDNIVHRCFERNTDTRTHLVLDLRQVSAFPRSLFQNKSRLTYKHEARMGWTILILDNSKANLIVKMVASFYRANFYASSSLSEGLSVLCRKKEAWDTQEEKVS